MIKHQQTGKSQMRLNSKVTYIAAAIAVSIGLSGGISASETTASGMRGKITGPDGQGDSNTTITITHVASGTTKTVTTDAAGIFNASGLRVGGPYTIIIDSNTYDDKTIDGLFLKLGEVFDASLQLTGANSGDTIVITASQTSSSTFGSTSPGSNFNLEDIDYAATADRDLKDIIRLDPRISIAEANGDEAIICGFGIFEKRSVCIIGQERGEGIDGRVRHNFGMVKSHGYLTE